MGIPAPPRYTAWQRGTFVDLPFGERMDTTTLWMIVVVVGGTALTLLLTGPGLWSEKWGWGWFDRKKGPPAGPRR